jgi:hypothetical protein
MVPRGGGIATQGPVSGAGHASNLGYTPFWRGWGLLCLVLGALLSYWCIFCPLASAINKEANLSLSMTGVVLSPVLLVMGLALTIFGKRAGDLFYLSPQQLSAVGSVFAAVMAGVGFLVYCCLKSVLESYGYHF